MADRLLLESGAPDGYLLENSSGVLSLEVFTPLNLFGVAQSGCWYDPSDLTTLFQSGTRAVPGPAVTADGDPVGLILDKSGNNNDLVQATSTKRALYKTSGGISWLQFDGVDDCYATSAALNLSAYGQLGVIAGFKPSSTSTLMVAELGPDISSTGGTFYVAAVNDPTAGKISMAINGGVGGPDGVATTAATYGSGVTSLISCQSVDIANASAAARLALRRNSAVEPITVSTDAGGAGTAFSAAQVLHVGSRNDATLFFAGNLYGLVIRGSAFTDTELGNVEAWETAKLTPATASDGSAAGVGSASGVGLSTAAGAGSAAGTGTAAAKAMSIGSASGTGNAAAIAQEIGLASGIGSASGVGGSLASGIGSAAGIGSASATGQAQALLAGSATGIGAATSVGKASALSDGVSAGVGSASAVGVSQARSAGAAAGIGSASATSGTGTSAIGSASGTGSATAGGIALRIGVGASVGTSTVAANSNTLVSTDGSSQGTSSASGSGLVLLTGAGLSAGFGVVVGAGQSIAQAQGFAQGTSGGDAAGSGILPAPVPAGRIVRIPAGRTSQATASGRRTVSARGRRW